MALLVRMQRSSAIWARLKMRELFRNPRVCDASLPVSLEKTELFECSLHLWRLEAGMQRELEAYLNLVSQLHEPSHCLGCPRARERMHILIAWFRTRRSAVVKMSAMSGAGRVMGVLECVYCASPCRLLVRLREGGLLSWRVLRESVVSGAQHGPRQGQVRRVPSRPQRGLRGRFHERGRLQRSRRRD